MPKVIVYVPAAAWRRLEERGLNPAATVREFAKRGYELSDHPERDLARLTARAQPRPITQADAQPRDIPSRTVTPDPHFKPDFK